MSISAPIRVPLGPLPLSRLFPAANTLPSPISLPSKRNAPSASSSYEAVKTRKVVRIDDEGYETIRRSRVKEVTPKAKAVLERDDLGIGKSPARRLFVGVGENHEEISLGISGAVATASTSPTCPRRSLAPSPPIELPSRPTNTFETDISIVPLPSPSTDNIPLHDPGFAIFPDETAHPQPHLGTGIGTPKSKRPTNTSVLAANPANLAQDAPSLIPSSASSSRTNDARYDEDQENIPLVLSTQSTPSKHSARSSPSKSGTLDAGEEIFSSPGGSGRRRLRTIERSKLGLRSVLRGEVDGEDEVEEDELTPGRREGLREREKGKGKARLTREVDRI